MSFDQQLRPDPLAAAEKTAREAFYIKGTAHPGYGVDIGAKKAQIVNQPRMMTTAPLKSVQAEVVTFQNSASDSKAGGGSCFGDSGGPFFLGRFAGGDASHVNSLTCNATGSYQRVDTPFLDSWIAAAG